MAACFYFIEERFMSDIKFEKCNDKEINDKCEVISAMTDEIAELREMLKKHKEFNEHMHEMSPEWTVKRSIELHKETIELLYSNNK
jgi:hypothetical protein